MPVSWTQAEPAHLECERVEVSALAPELRWVTGLRCGRRADLVGFEGPLPAWCAPRPKPDGLDEVLGEERIEVQIAYREATPIVPPSIRPVHPDVPIERRTDHTWHVNGDGSLCLLQTADLWVPGSTAAPLIVKASCWFIEYLLMERGLIDTMTKHGIADDTVHDEVIAGARP